MGESLNEALIETWSCETGELKKTERVETYFHLSEDGEVLTPRALCDRCRERFELEKKGSKDLFKGKKKPPDPNAKPVPAPAKPAAASVESDSLAELEKKASDAASEYPEDRPARGGLGDEAPEDHRGPRHPGSAFSEWKNYPRAAQAVAKEIEGRIDLSAPEDYYVLRSFGWQRVRRERPRGRALLLRALHQARALGRAPITASPS